MSKSTIELSETAQVLLRELVETTGQSMAVVLDQALAAYRRELAASFLNNLCYNSDMANSTVISDADVLEHVFSPIEGGLDPDAARAILDLKFDKDATKRIRQLLQKNNRGTISTEERITLEKFLRVGKLIDLFHAKARLSLKEAGLSV